MPAPQHPFRMAFVCLGNICRSPTAEGVARHLIAQRGLSDIAVESAGTAAYHVGSPPDERAVAAAAARGIVVEGTARRFEAADLERLDLVVAMDRTNLEDLRTLASRQRGRPIPPLRLLRDWDPEADSVDVPDPYYGGPAGFEQVLDIVTRSVEGLLDDLVQHDHQADTADG